MLYAVFSKCPFLLTSTFMLGLDLKKYILLEKTCSVYVSISSLLGFGGDLIICTMYKNILINHLIH